jgi:hypothetical protein
MRSKLTSTAPVSPRGPLSQYLQARAVADRYGVHLGSLSRWIARGIFPKPDLVIADRRYWKVGTLDALDREHTIQLAKTKSAIGTAAPEAAE